MKNVTAILSMLHEPAECNSATRLFRQDPVLCWTIDRLSRSERLDGIIVLCWEDQEQLVEPIAREGHADMLVKGPRQAVPSIEAVAAAQKFADGWRGGLLSTCEFDAGFYAPWCNEIAQHHDADAVLVVDPASGLVDFDIVDDTIEQALEHEDAEIFFTQAAPGLAGALIRKVLLERLAKVCTHPGRILHYMPDQPARDPIGGEGCVAVPTPIARTTRRFKLDSQRQIDRITSAAVSLNGTLVTSSGQELLNRLEAHANPDLLPRDVTLELTTRRDSSPIFLPSGIKRPDLTLDIAKQIFAQLAAFDDMRITLGGVGDPLLHDEFVQIVRAARDGGIAAIHVETDLLVAADRVEQLVDAGVDVVSVNLPAMQTGTYAKIMGVDRFTDAIENIKRFVVHRQIRRRGVPLLVPTFVKLAENLAEMETWYDQWLRAIGSAVIVGPSDFAGQMPTIELADMQPPKRIACRRLASRLTILSDGAIVACEQDIRGKSKMGTIGADLIRDVWRQKIGTMRCDHASGNWNRHPLCATCREWHRP
jgi:radical SAM family protein/iron-sulfur cluster protein